MNTLGFIIILNWIPSICLSKFILFSYLPCSIPWEAIFSTSTDSFVLWFPLGLANMGDFEWEITGGEGCEVGQLLSFPCGRTFPRKHTAFFWWSKHTACLFPHSNSYCILFAKKVSLLLVYSLESNSSIEVSQIAGQVYVFCWTLDWNKWSEIIV